MSLNSDKCSDILLVSDLPPCDHVFELACCIFQALCKLLIIRIFIVVSEPLRSLSYITYSTHSVCCKLTGIYCCHNADAFIDVKLHAFNICKILLIKSRKGVVSKREMHENTDNVQFCIVHKFKAFSRTAKLIDHSCAVKRRCCS